MYKVAVAMRIFISLPSLKHQSIAFGLTVDVDIAALVSFNASRAASPEPCGPRGTAPKRSLPPRERARRAASPAPRRRLRDAIAHQETREERYTRINRGERGAARSLAHE